jgi:hypothetical protein
MSWSLFTSGQTPISWADALLKAGGWPVTAANEQSLIAWAIQEGGGVTYNPTNTTEPGYGSTGTLNSAGVQNYPSWSQGISATVATLKSSDYSAITSDLASGNGISSNASTALSTWGTGSYAVSISDHWSAAAAYLSGKAVALPGGSPSGTPTSSPSSGGLLSFPASITNAFGDVDALISHLAWLVNPASWLRIGAFLVGVALLLYAIYALVAIGDGGSMVPSMPSVMPVPV